MRYKIEKIETGLWRRIIEELEAEGFVETYAYGGMDAGIDYGRYDLKNPADGELIVFEWDNWSEGEVTAAPSRLEALRERYGLPAPSEAGE